jgi:hypothetical protein
MSKEATMPNTREREATAVMEKQIERRESLQERLLRDYRNHLEAELRDVEQQLEALSR